MGRINRKAALIFLSRFVFLSLFAFLLTGCHIKQHIQNAEGILINLQKSYVAIVDLIISVAYLSGAGLVMKGIYAFKVYGEQRTMLSPQVSIKVPIAYFFVGVALLWLPMLISIVTNSIFLDPDVKLISYDAGASWSNQVKNAVYASIQVMGLIAIIRACFLATVHQPIGGGGGQGGMGKAALHFAGGLAAVNIDKLLNITQDIFSG